MKSKEVLQNKRELANVFRVLMSVSSRISRSFSSLQTSSHLEWYKMRDFFLGQNYVNQDISRALELAAACQHPDAVYLSKILVAKDICKKEQARALFLSQPADDARELCFSELIISRDSWEWDAHRIKPSAELGFAFAQARAVELTFDGEERFQLAQASAGQRERDGFNVMGFLCLGVAF